MTAIEEELEADVYWRQGQLSTLRSIGKHNSLSQQQCKCLRTYTIPAIYSLWEGLIKQSLGIYLRAVNQEHIPLIKLHLNYITHVVDVQTNLQNARPHVEDRRKCVRELCKLFTDEYVTVSDEKLPTESNVNYKVLNKILQTFNLDNLDKNWEKGLNKLLCFRNKIAHGDNSIVVEDEDIDYFANMLNALMAEVCSLIMDDVKEKRYLKQTC